jgi:thiol-disulfide isomerase/thioredoxin
MKKLSLIITSTLLVISCNNKKETYYQAPNGKVFTAQEYQEAKLKMSERGEIKEVILSSIERNDSIIKLFNTTVKEENSYAEIDKFIGEKLPFESLIDLAGNKINLNSLNGKPTMVNLWFVNCKPCIEEIPELNRIKKNYGDRVNFLAVTFNSKEVVNKFLSKNQFDFNHIIDAQSEIDKLNNNSYPLNLYLDKNGIITSYESMINNDKKNGVNKELEKLL